MAYVEGDSWFYKKSPFHIMGKYIQRPAPEIDLDNPVLFQQMRYAVLRYVLRIKRDHPGKKSVFAQSGTPFSIGGHRTRVHHAYRYIRVLQFFIQTQREGVYKCL